MLAIVIDDPGSVFFTQKRVGKGKSHFQLIKFRSMKMSTPHDTPTHLLENPEQYITKVGKFLRKTSLDEIPQLWCVFVGTMSFVGPRPERQYFIDEIMKHNPNYPVIFRMRPGVTSRATIYNGYTDTMEKMLIRLEMDLAYYEERTWLLDIRLLVLTFLKIVGGKKF
jgi:lipopolysaccharide/colanic/teichoic acid biosynthesis glycosyltransferase